LNFIVDPTVDALVDDSGLDPSELIDDPSSNNVVNGKPRNPFPKRKVRKKGSGKSPNKTKKNTTSPVPLAFVQANGDSQSSSGGPLTLAFLSDVTQGNLLIFGIATSDSSQSGASISVAVSDSQGNSYNQAGGYVTVIRGGNQQLRLSVWYVITPSSGPCTITYTPSGSTGIQSYTGLLEYMSVSTGPLDNTSSNSGSCAAVGTYSVSSVGGDGELVLGFFSNLFTGFAAAGGMTTRVSGALFLVEEAIGATAPSATGGGFASDVYVAMGVAFKPAPLSQAIKPSSGNGVAKLQAGAGIAGLGVSGVGALAPGGFRGA
jgi:hypothetical protein